MAKSVTVKVPFAGAILEGVLVGGKAYVAMRPIVEGMGLEWSRQLQKIKADEVLSEVVYEMYTTSIGADGKDYKVKMICLPEEYLQGWLFTVYPNKVRSDLRSKILAYRRECYRVLHAALSQGRLDANDRVHAIDSKRAMGSAMTDVVKDFMELSGKTSKPYHYSNEHLLCNFILTGRREPLDEATLTTQQLKLLTDIRRRNLVLFNRGLDTQTRKAMLSEFAIEWRRLRAPALKKAA